MFRASTSRLSLTIVLALKYDRKASDLPEGKHRAVFLSEILYRADCRLNPVGSF